LNRAHPRARPAQAGQRSGPVAVVSIALYLGALGCTTTVIDPSARARDPAALWDEQIAQATRAHRQGRLESASEWYDRALATSRAFPAGDSRMLETLHQRAGLQLLRGQYEAAKKDYREIIAVERARTPSDPAALANALNDLAVFDLDLDRISEAETLLAEAIEIRTALYGSDHPYVAVLLQNLGDAERRAGNYPVSEQLLLRALSIYARSGRDFWREASIAQNNLALLQAATGRERESEASHLAAIRLSTRALGAHNTDVGVFDRDLAMLYTDQARYAEADALFRASISILRDGLGESSHQLSKTYRAYSEMLAAAGRGPEAAAYRRRAEATGY